MTTLLTSSPPIVTIADLLDSLGGVPDNRVRYHPRPGTATEQDVIDIDAHEDRLFELVDGTLVEKPMGYEESLLAMWIGEFLNGFVVPRKLGWVSGEAGMMRILPGQVRMPDVAFVSRERAPGGRRPVGPVAALAPDLAVEVLRASNTAAEMARKRREYFEGGTRLVWASTRLPGRPPSTRHPKRRRPSSASMRRSTAATSCPASRSTSGRCSPGSTTEPDGPR